jgi:putative Mg2+ transporter-C (MgtC) family protein
MVELGAATINMAVAVACGALIGSERQVRQRMAGLRTNALVALGAAAFVTFSQLVPNDASPTRVAAQVVSGIGFLGAGIIFRDGFNVHGLNTAATLWCSAAIGVVAGIGKWPYALVITAMVVFINLGLRPFVKWLKKHTNAGVPMVKGYRVILSTEPANEAVMRAKLMHVLTVAGVHISEISAQTGEGGLDLAVTISAEGFAETLIEQSVQRLATEPGIRRLRWMPVEEA